VAAREAGTPLSGARVAVQGFGSVGAHAARSLVEAGALLVGASDSRGAIANAKGLDVAALVELKRSGKSVADHPDGERITPEALVALECEIWIPAARPDALREDNVRSLRARLVVSGANLGATLEAERILHEAGVLCVPDFIANAGGVICAAMEWAGATEAAAFAAIEERIRRNTETVLQTARQRRVLPRQAAVELAGQRVRRAMATRRWSIF
jgi:glutamate dehydrogenase (NAD(P)+)